MVVPIVAKQRKKQNKKSFLRRAWPFILGTGFMAMVATVVIVALVTGIRIFNYIH
jgi:hypothetical protein